MDRADRIEYLRTLVDGWLDGAGKAPTEEALDAAMGILESRLYPTEVGGVSMEYDIDGETRVIEIQPDGYILFGAWAG